MNWVTTNIRFPKEDYLELKMEAVRLRKSLSALVRERVIRKKRAKRTDANTFLRKLDKLAKENDKYTKGKSLSDLLIEMRYEQ